jgi:hypothetical protein
MNTNTSILAKVGILGIDDDVRNGFGAIRVHFDISRCKRGRHQGGAGRTVTEAVDIITNPTNVLILERTCTLQRPA